MSSITALTWKSLNLNCCYVHRSKNAGLVALYFTGTYEVSSLAAVSYLLTWINSQQTTSWFILPASKPLGAHWYRFHVQKKKKKKKKERKAGPTRGVIVDMNLLCFNQPTKRHLISMLKRMARSLLVQRCLYTVWLERNNNTVPIRGRCNSPIPVQHLPVAPDRTCFAQFNQLQNADRHWRGTRGHTRAHTHTSITHH